MKLISMTDFVLNQMGDLSQCYKACNKYAYFLKQPLTLGMFVSCDESGNVLEEPKAFERYVKDKHGFGTNEWVENCKKYQQAKERALFDTKLGLSQVKYLINKFRIIDDLTRITFFTDYSELTQTALKQIGI